MYNKLAALIHCESGMGHLATIIGSWKPISFGQSAQSGSEPPVWINKTKYEVGFGKDIIFRKDGTFTLTDDAGTSNGTYTYTMDPNSTERRILTFNGKSFTVSLPKEERIWVHWKEPNENNIIINCTLVIQKQ